jgi:hypothetical protein
MGMQGRRRTKELPTFSRGMLSRRHRLPDRRAQGRLLGLGLEVPDRDIEFAVQLAPRDMDNRQHRRASIIPLGIPLDVCPDAFAVEAPLHTLPTESPHRIAQARVAILGPPIRRDIDDRPGAFGLHLAVTVAKRVADNLD